MNYRYFAREREMEMSKKSNSNNGIGFVGLLTILFIGLKLTGNITWSWLWVLSPIWICTIIVLVLLGAAVVFFKD